MNEGGEGYNPYREEQREVIMDPVTGICDAAMRAFAEASSRASKDSPLAKARARLGERYAEAACEGLRQVIKTFILDDENREAALAPASPGRAFETMFLATVIADVSAYVIEQANKE